MPNYKLEAGVGKHRVGSIVYRPGDTMNLTEYQAERISDKLETTSHVVKEPTEAEKPRPKVAEKAPVEEKVEEPVPSPSEASTLRLVAAPGGMWNVFNAENQANVNDEPLTHEEALELMNRDAQ